MGLSICGRRSTFVIATALSFLGLSTTAFGHVLREWKTPCGAYLAHLSNTSKGELLAPNFNGSAIHDALIARASGVDSSGHVVYLVGAPFERSLQKPLMDAIIATLRDAGYPLPVRAIARVPKSAEEEFGLYAEDRRTGVRQRVSRLTVDEVTASLQDSRWESARPIMIGESGNRAADIEILELLERRFPGALRWESALLTHAKWAANSFFYFFPIRQDYQVPTEHEVETAAIRVSLPAVATVITTGFIQAQPLAVVIPTVLANAGNSTFTGIYRTSINNWRLRSPSFWSLLAKDVLLCSLFTTNIYWMSRGSFEEFAEVATVSGWATFLQHKWPSIALNVFWRNPFGRAVAIRERAKTAAGGTEANVQARREGSALEFLASLVITQFYIYSTMTQHSLYQFKWNGVTVLDANAGTLVMLSFGLYSIAALKYPALLDPVARLAPKVMEVTRLDLAGKWIGAVLFRIGKFGYAQVRRARQWGRKGFDRSRTTRDRLTSLKE